MSHSGTRPLADMVEQSGLDHFPSNDFETNQAWLTTVLIACDLTYWTQGLCLSAAMARAEPKKLPLDERTHCLQSFDDFIAGMERLTEPNSKYIVTRRLHDAIYEVVNIRFDDVPQGKVVDEEWDTTDFESKLIDLPGPQLLRLRVPALGHGRGNNEVRSVTPHWFWMNSLTIRVHLTVATTAEATGRDISWWRVYREIPRYFRLIAPRAGV